MNYEIVNLEEKIIVGVSTVTSNQDIDMGKNIGELWTELYQGGVNCKIKNKVNEYAVGLYSDYTKDGHYTVMAGNEVSKAEDIDLVTKIIASGSYAKVSVQGDMEEAVYSAWETIWKTELDRSYTGNFEEYLDSDFENCRIDIYIALN